MSDGVLEAAIPWIRRVERVGTTGSTNDDARRLAAAGAPEGTVVIATAQTAGRGRLGRIWESPEGTGMYLSALLRPDEPAELLGRYALLAAVTTCEACRALGAERVVLKWPNDLLAAGRKLAGILAELRSQASSAELVIGIGVNVHPLSAESIARAGRPATSLREEGCDASVTPDEVAVRVLERLADGIDLLRRGGWDEIAERFLRYAPDAAGRRVELADGRSGLTRGLHPTGALRVETGSGEVLVHAGDSLRAIEG